MAVKIIAPFAPFLADELYQVVGGTTTSIHTTTWPAWDESQIQVESITVGIQINGKVRGELKIAQADTTNEGKVLEAAKAQPVIQQWLEGKEIIKEIYVPGKIVSIAVR
jgi:leucyl-tRNA synthetase